VGAVGGVEAEQVVEAEPVWTARFNQMDGSESL
jgi:hypothetical protein